MKRLPQLVSLAIILVFAGCTKDFKNINPDNSHSPQLDSIAQFLKTNFPDQVSKLKLESIQELFYHKENIGYQIFDKSDSKKFLVIKKVLLGYSGNWIDLTELTKSPSNSYSGKIRMKPLDNEINSDLIVENNKVVRVEKWDKALSRIIEVDPFQAQKTLNKSWSHRDGMNSQEEILLPEVIIVINKMDYLSLYWILNDYNSYSFLYIQNGDPSSSGGLGGTTGIPNQNTQNENIIALPVYTGPKNPITNLSDELKCFTVNSKSTYSISVNVNQPRPNSRDKVDPSNNFAAGHTFFSLEQVNSDGSKIIRNIGFYPKNSVYPGNFEDASIFGDDSDTPFSVSLKVTVTAAEMITVLNSMKEQQSVPYNLENSNCVSSVTSSLEKINIHLPMTSSGIEYLFKGVNPGDLGQDIRNLDLNQFQAKNGNRKVVRSTSEKNNYQPSQKKGSC